MKRTFFTMVKIALRNVRLQKRRSAFIVLILMIGCTGLLLVAGFFEGVLLNLREQFIHGVTGHLMLAKAGYYGHGVANPFDHLLSSPRSLSERWLNRPEVSAVIPRLQFEGLLSTEQKASAVGIIGVDPVAESRMGLYGNEKGKTSAMKIIEGRDLDPSDPNGIILGRGVSKILKVKISDPLSLLVTTKSGSIDGANYHVRGIFETPIREFDNQFIKINLSSAQTVSQVGDAVTSLLIMLHDTGSTRAVQSDLVHGLKTSSYEVLSWEERGEFYRNGRDILKQINFILQLVFASLIFFSILSSVNMAFFERIREFGTMMALGNPRIFILFLVTMETFLVGLIGVCLGLGMAVLSSLLIAKFGFEMPPLPGSTSGYEAKVVLSPLLFLKVAGIGLIAALLSSLFVSLRAYSLRIVNALGYV
jgi:ABC-type transport system, involved in lipoprotein release, permease component